MGKGPLKLRQLLKRLKPYGIEVLQRKGSNPGKGSELILIKPNSPGSRKGPQYPIKSHGQGTEIYTPVIDKLLDHFGIDKKEFWNK